MADFDILPSEEPDDFNELLGDITPKTGFGEARFVVTRNGKIVDVKIKASDVLVRSVGREHFEGEEPAPRTALRLDYEAGTLSIYPQLIYFSDRLYQQKYKQLEEIQIDLPLEPGVPEEHFGVVDVMKVIPNGFIKDPSFGLGFVKEMKPLVKSIQELKDVRRLVISEKETTRVGGATFYMGTEEYITLRNGMNRIARHHQTDSLIERELMAHNNSIHKAMPDAHRYKERPYRPGTVYKLLGGTQSAVVNLRGKDRVSVLNAIAGNASAIAMRDPQEFVQLQKDIEIVGLDKLIDAVKSHISHNSAEGVWQTLLELNPFILSMLFGQPIVLLQAGAAVGGQTLSGSGTKIADFLAKNALSHNAALVELKRPKTALLAKTEYRGGVFGPSKELMGAVTQVLDQRIKLTTNIAQTLYNSKINSLDVSAIECVVVAGIMPSEEATIRSFELLRNSFKDVRIITFDEMLERLQILRELLAGERYVSEIEDEPDDTFDIFSPFEEDNDDGGRWDELDDEDRDPRD